jgi:3-carboxy-cis,cis-muconate cycloisomerase
MLLTSNYYRDMFGTHAMRAIFSDDRRFTSWLETEVALAKVQALPEYHMKPRMNTDRHR